jgi:ribosomal protein S18 acetylase RimI-like enzyme
MKSETLTERVARADLMPGLGKSITVREATPADQDFLKALFASTRGDELAALALDTKQAAAFIDMQFNVQQQSYSARYPTARNNIILLDECRVGRMLVDRTEGVITLVDIALLGEYRNRGIGSFLIRGLIDEATASQKPVRLSVYKFNPAARLYHRLGFSTVEDRGIYLEMERKPGASD